MEWAEIYGRLVRDRDDEKAWGSLRARVLPWARRALWERGWHVVDDAVEDTCSTAVICFQNARGPDTFAGFVYGHFLNIRRRALQEPCMAPVPEDLAAASTVEPSDDELALLYRCLDELPDRERRAVELRYLEEATAERIAEVMGVSKVNARQLVFRGMLRLRDCAGGRSSLGRRADADGSL